MWTVSGDMGQVQAREASLSGPSEDPDFALDSIKAKVVSVSVDGLNRTKDDVILSNVGELFKVDREVACHLSL